MSNEIHDAMKRILDNGEVPPRVTNRLLLAAMLQIAERQDRTEEAVRDLAGRLHEVETFPSVLSLLWRHPKTTIAVIVILFGLLTLAYTAGGIPLF